MTYAKNARSGFTLIEIMIAVFIVALMGALVGPLVWSRLEKGKQTKAKADLKALEQGLEMFSAQVGSYPETLKDLVQEPTDADMKGNWQGPYLTFKTVPKDPWNRAYQYQVTPGQTNPYDLYSYGKGGKGTPKDKISVWDEK